jgi:hemerythrin superfamily protein
MMNARATDVIRADHARVLASFRRYSIAARPQANQALVQGACRAIELHARIEEEIFYPAMREAGSDLSGELVPEHEEIRRLIAMLRGMDATDVQYDQVFVELMRDVMHHVADEETILLTHAESVLGERLGELGARMMKRRLELRAPRAAEMARRAVPRALLMGAGALLAGALVVRQLRRHA